MTRAWLRVAAAATIGVIAAVPIALNLPGRTPRVAPQGVDRPIADTQGDATIATDAPATSVAETVPPSTIDVSSTVVQAPPAASTTTVTAGPPTTVGVIDNRALALIRYPWTKLGYQITFHGPKAGFFGLTDCQTRHIDIYVTAGQSVAQVAYVTAFEIGHAIDCTDQVSGHRAEWSTLRGFRRIGPWFPSCTCAEDSFGSGDFSEVFARWQVGPVYPWRSTLAPAPTAAQMATLAPLFG